MNPTPQCLYWTMDQIMFATNVIHEVSFRVEAQWVTTMFLQQRGWERQHPRNFRPNDFCDSCKKYNLQKEKVKPHITHDFLWMVRGPMHWVQLWTKQCCLCLGHLNTSFLVDVINLNTYEFPTPSQEDAQQWGPPISAERMLWGYIQWYMFTYWGVLL